MSLVKAWLYFPEALSVYGRRNSHSKRHDLYENYRNEDSDIEDEQSNIKKYSNDVIQRVRRVLNFLEEENTESDDDSSKNRNIERSDDFGSILPQNRKTEEIKSSIDSPNNFKNWNDGIDMRVAKSGENEAGYDIYHLTPRNDEAKGSRDSYPSSSESFGSGESNSKDEPQQFVNRESMRSRETQYSRDLNIHNKGHLKNTAGSEADVLPGDLQTTSEKQPKTVVVDKKQASHTGRKSSVDESNFKKEHFYPAELHDARDLEQNPSAGMICLLS